MFSTYNVGLNKNIQQGPPDSKIQGDLAYKLWRIAVISAFPKQFEKVIKCAYIGSVILTIMFCHCLFIDSSYFSASGRNKNKKGLPVETKNTQNHENRGLVLIVSLHMQHCSLRGCIRTLLPPTPPPPPPTPPPTHTHLAPAESVFDFQNNLDGLNDPKRSSSSFLGNLI